MLSCSVHPSNVHKHCLKLNDGIQEQLKVGSWFHSQSEVISDFLENLLSPPPPRGSVLKICFNGVRLRLIDLGVLWETWIISGTAGRENLISPPAMMFWIA